MQVLRDISHLSVAPLFGKETEREGQKEKEIFGITEKKKKRRKEGTVSGKGDKLRR